MLRHAPVKVLEVHDFTPPSDSDNSSSDSSEPGDDGYPGYDFGRGRLRPWPRIFQLAGESSSSGEPWPSLPRAGGGANWSSGGPAKNVGEHGTVGRFPRSQAGPNGVQAPFLQDPAKDRFSQKPRAPAASPRKAKARRHASRPSPASSLQTGQDAMLLGGAQQRMVAGARWSRGR
jgi:hypothetical protein